MQDFTLDQCIFLYLKLQKKVAAKKVKEFQVQIIDGNKEKTPLKWIEEIRERSRKKNECKNTIDDQKLIGEISGLKINTNYESEEVKFFVDYLLEKPLYFIKEKAKQLGLLSNINERNRIVMLSHDINLDYKNNPYDDVRNVRTIYLYHDEDSGELKVYSYEMGNPVPYYISHKHKFKILSLMYGRNEVHRSDQSYEEIELLCDYAKINGVKKIEDLVFKISRTLANIKASQWLLISGKKNLHEIVDGDIKYENIKEIYGDIIGMLYEAYHQLDNDIKQSKGILRWEIIKNLKNVRKWKENNEDLRILNSELKRIQGIFKKVEENELLNRKYALIDLLDEKKIAYVLNESDPDDFNIDYQPEVVRLEMLLFDHELFNNPEKVFKLAKLMEIEYKESIANNPEEFKRFVIGLRHRMMDAEPFIKIKNQKIPLMVMECLEILRRNLSLKGKTIDPVIMKFYTNVKNHNSSINDIATTISGQDIGDIWRLIELLKIPVEFCSLHKEKIVDFLNKDLSIVKTFKISESLASSKDKYSLEKEKKDLNKNQIKLTSNRFSADEKNFRKLLNSNFKKEYLELIGNKFQTTNLNPVSKIVNTIILIMEGLCKDKETFKKYIKSSSDLLGFQEILSSFCDNGFTKKEKFFSVIFLIEFVKIFIDTPIKKEFFKKLLNNSVDLELLAMGLNLSFLISKNRKINSAGVACLITLMFDKKNLIKDANKKIDVQEFIHLYENVKLSNLSEEKTINEKNDHNDKNEYKGLDLYKILTVNPDQHIKEIERLFEINKMVLKKNLEELPPSPSCKEEREKITNQQSEMEFAKSIIFDKEKKKKYDEYRKKIEIELEIKKKAEEDEEDDDDDEGGDENNQNEGEGSDNEIEIDVENEEERTYRIEYNSLDLYSILGITEHENLEEIKRVCESIEKNLSSNSDSDKKFTLEEEKQKEIDIANQKLAIKILLDPKNKEKYDNCRRVVMRDSADDEQNTFYDDVEVDENCYKTLGWCELFFMSSKSRLKSDKNHVYLYKEVKDGEEEFYYEIKDQDEKQYLDLSRDEPTKKALKAEKFNQKESKQLQKCQKEQIYKAVFAQTSEKGHTPLRLEKDASEKEVQTAYRKLAKELHPDKNSSNVERFKEVTTAYEIFTKKFTKKREQDEKFEKLLNDEKTNINDLFIYIDCKDELPEVKEILGYLVGKDLKLLFTKAEQLQLKSPDDQIKSFQKFKELLLNVAKKMAILKELACSDEKISKSIIEDGRYKFKNCKFSEIEQIGKDVIEKLNLDDKEKKQEFKLGQNHKINKIVENLNRIYHTENKNSTPELECLIFLSQQERDDFWDLVQLLEIPCPIKFFNDGKLLPFFYDNDLSNLNDLHKDRDIKNIIEEKIEKFTENRGKLFNRNFQEKHLEFFAKEMEIEKYSLYLMSNFSIEKCKEIKGKAVILTNENKAYFVVDNEIFFDDENDENPQFVIIDNRQEIEFSNSEKPEKYAGSKNIENVIQEAISKGGYAKIDDKVFQEIESDILNTMKDEETFEEFKDLMLSKDFKIDNENLIPNYDSTEEQRLYLVKDQDFFAFHVLKIFLLSFFKDKDKNQFFFYQTLMDKTSDLDKISKALEIDFWLADSLVINQAGKACLIVFEFAKKGFFKKQNGDSRDLVPLISQLSDLADTGSLKDLNDLNSFDIPVPVKEIKLVEEKKSVEESKTSERKVELPLPISPDLTDLTNNKKPEIKEQKSPLSQRFSPAKIPLFSLSPKLPPAVPQKIVEIKNKYTGELFPLIDQFCNSVGNGFSVRLLKGATARKRSAEIKKLKDDIIKFSSDKREDNAYLALLLQKTESIFTVFDQKTKDNKVGSTNEHRKKIADFFSKKVKDIINNNELPQDLKKFLMDNFSLIEMLWENTQFCCHQPQQSKKFRRELIELIIGPDFKMSMARKILMDISYLFVQMNAGIPKISFKNSQTGKALMLFYSNYLFDQDTRYSEDSNREKLMEDFNESLYIFSGCSSLSPNIKVLIQRNFDLLKKISTPGVGATNSEKAKNLRNSVIGLIFSSNPEKVSTQDVNFLLKEISTLVNPGERSTFGHFGH